MIEWRENVNSQQETIRHSFWLANLFSKVCLCHFTTIRVIPADKRSWILPPQSWSSLNYNLKMKLNIKEKTQEFNFKWNITVCNAYLIIWKIRWHKKGPNYLSRKDFLLESALVWQEKNRKRNTPILVQPRMLVGISFCSFRLLILIMYPGSNLG